MTRYLIVPPVVSAEMKRASERNNVDLWNILGVYPQRSRAEKTARREAIYALWDMQKEDGSRRFSAGQLAIYFGTSSAAIGQTLKRRK
jgi:hypothetical protein